MDVRIGELSRRVGVSAEALRAWEQRYGLLQPRRTSSGYRIYAQDDQRRALRMKQLIDQGVAAAEAARAVAQAWLDARPLPVAEDAGRLRAARSTIQEALLAFDGASAHECLDRLLDSHTVDMVLRDVVLPLLHDVGSAWEANRLSVSQEHFAAELLGGRLRAFARDWDGGLGPRALLACPPGELHDLGLLCCGLALSHRGWRVTYLGADTPLRAIEEVAERIAPDVVVLAAVMPGPLHDAADGVAEISAHVPVAVGGNGAHPKAALRAGARLLREDPVSAAGSLTAAQVG